MGQVSQSGHLKGTFTTLTLLLHNSSIPTLWINEWSPDLVLKKRYQMKSTNLFTGTLTFLPGQNMKVLELCHVELQLCNKIQMKMHKFKVIRQVSLIRLDTKSYLTSCSQNVVPIKNSGRSVHATKSRCSKLLICFNAASILKCTSMECFTFIHL